MADNQATMENLQHARQAVRDARHRQIFSIYVASPYTAGDPIVNTARAIDAGNELLSLGFYPFIPHAMTQPWHFRHHHTYEEWLRYDFYWVGRCDAVLRLEGESGGADREVKLAKEKGIPVYYGVDGINELRGIAEARRLAGMTAADVVAEAARNHCQAG